MAIKINQLEIENVKRIKAVMMHPSENGLTIIGGDNGQGKTSVLDAIAWALGGEKYRPSMAQRDGSVTPPNLKIRMSNGLLVERKGKNSALTVTDPSGQKAGQTLLNEFVEELALNLPKFMEASGKEKASTLLQIIGVGSQLAQLEQEEKEIYQERLFVGRTADQKKKFAQEQPFYPDVPDEPVSPSELIQQQREILARNAQRQQWKRDYDGILAEIDILKQKTEEYERVAREGREKIRELEEKAKAAAKSPAELKMESTEELEASIASIEEINWKVRANLDKEKAEEDARVHQKKYQELSQKLDDVRKAKTDLLSGAKLPLEGLSVEDGELTYCGQKWDNLSGAERLVVSTAIVKELNPNCGFVLLDKLEQMDMKTLQTFGAWLEKQGLQAIATRVSTGSECSIVIEDGYAVEQDAAKTPEPEPAATNDWSKFAL